MSSDSKNITINLTKGFGAISFEEHELIQTDAYDFIGKKIEKRLDSNQLDHGVFFINGTRGAGKSAFLNSVIEFIENKNKSDSKNQVALLINLDPTKVETGENIFVSIIQKLAEKIENKYKGDLKVHFDKSNNEYEVWRKKLKSLAGGISLLGKNHDGIEQFNEDRIALDWGMQKVKSGLSLAQSFKDLVKYAQKILGVSAFIVAIDDADTNFDQGKAVLELIRRYLDIPQLIIFVAGDLRLYTHLVRNMFAVNLIRSYKLNSDTDIENKKYLLDHMVDQYLKKIFPIQNRIELKTLKVLSNKYQYTIKAMIDGKKETEFKLNELINQIVREGLSVKSQSDVDSYKEFLLSQPVRSIIQLLYLCTSQAETVLSEDRTEYSFSKEKVAEAFRHIFFDDLYRYGIENDGLSNKELSVLNHSVFNAVIKDGELDTGCYLRPQPKDESLKSVFVALAANVAWQTENNLAATLDYMLQGIGSQFVYNLCLSDFSDKFQQKEQIDNFKNYFSLGRSEDALNWAWHYCGSLDFRSNNNRVYAGVIGLNLKTPRTNRRKENYKLLNSIKNNIKNDEFGLPVVYYSLVQISASNSELYSSIFNILGLVSKILYACTGKEELESKKSIQSILNKQENIVSISPALWRLKQDSNDDETDENLEIDENISNSGMVNIILDWVNKVFSASIQPSSILIGKIWTRLYFSIVNISGKHRTSNELAKIMELYALAVINAFLIEELEHHVLCKNEAIDIDRKNPLTNPDHVINKFKKISNSGSHIKELPLTYMMVTCPMLLGLLDKSNAIELIGYVEDNEDLKKFVEELNGKFDDLNKVYIAAK